MRPRAERPSKGGRLRSGRLRAAVCGAAVHGAAVYGAALYGAAVYGAVAGRPHNAVAARRNGVCAGPLSRRAVKPPGGSLASAPVFTGSRFRERRSVTGDVMTTEPRHLAVRGGLRADRERLVNSLPLPPLLIPPVDADARLRGPYTAGGVIARAVTETALQSDPQLARRHDVEIRALVPDLRDAVPVVREALTEAVPPAERTRIYPRLRTRRLAHGLTEFIRDYMTRLHGDGPCSLIIENLHHADPSDRELVSVLVRRIDAAALVIVACEIGPGVGGGWDVAAGRSAGGGRDAGGGPGSHGRPLAPSGDLLAEALATHAVQVQVPEHRQGAQIGEERRRLPGDDASLAERYVRSDCVSDEWVLLDAYARLSASARALLHDTRADQLERSGDQAARLGAIPYHREHGSDPAGAGTRTLADAAQHCFAAGFHDAVTELCTRGRALANPELDPHHWWLFTSLAAGSLAALGRGAEAEELYDEARAASTEAKIHRIAAYETAMLYARHHDSGRRDPARALAWINEAIAFAGLVRDPEDRGFNVAFVTNGRARLGRAQRALELVDEGLAVFERELPPEGHPLDRCSLLANRARLLAMRGMLTEALAVQDALIALDPTYGEYHFDRGNLLHTLGRDDEALAAYAESERLSLPFPELHYNQADLLAARGDEDAAVVEFGRVLELDPGFLDAFVNRAGILAARGERVAAWADVNAGLGLDPANPYLLCVLGQLEAAEGRMAPARAAFDAAIAASPDLPAAWASRAVLRLQAGDPDAAVADLTRALEHSQDASLLFNRATAHRAAGRLAAARNDAERALTLRPDDPDTLELLAEITAGM